MYRPTLLDYMKVSLEYPALRFPKIQKKWCPDLIIPEVVTPVMILGQLSNIASGTCRLNYIIVVVRFNPRCEGW